MSKAKEKTVSLERGFLPIDVLVPNDENPNEMDEASFNLLYDNVEKMGMTDPILVRPLPDQEGFYKVIGGHHRLEVAKLHGLEEVPVTVVNDPEFDDDMERFQMVRHNIIHGKMNPKKFIKLYESLQGKYSETVAADLFGFADEEEFKKLVQSTAQSLPPEMKQQFLDASKEIKTIDDLSMVLNKLFTAYGDTVPYGFMVFDYGGQDHVWLRMQKKQKADMLALGKFCQENNRTVDRVMTVVLQLIAQGEFSHDQFLEEVGKLPEITLTGVELDEEDQGTLLTEDFIASLSKEM